MSLQWDANPEPNIDHYVVYCRPLAGGPFSRVNDFPIAHMGAPSTISFTDTSNAAACGGLPAEYVITAIDAEGEESGFSNAVPIATTTLPAPIVVDCTEANLIAGIAQANGSGGGTITFNCQNQTIFLGQGLGSFQGNVVLDGENPNIILEYSGPFAGCVTGKNEIGGPAIVQLTGGNNVVRNLTFRNFLESLQISGPGNTIENNNFMAHLCSDDGLSTIDVAAVGTLVQGNLFEDYKDKAFQMSFGGGTVTANTFVDSKQPIRAPFDNSAGDTFILTDNVITTTPGNTSACDGVRIDGTYHIVFEGNTHSFCKRGVRLGGDIEAEIRDNVINDNQQAGIRLGGNARASLSGNTIQDNGSVPGSLPEGGVVVWENAEVDLGGGSLMIGGQLLSSVGQNTLTGNNVVDARNLRVGFTLTAENNCWDNSTVADVLAQDVEGTVDVNPIACSSTTTTTTTTTTTSSTTSTTVTTTTTSSTTSTIVTTTTTTTSSTTTTLLQENGDLKWTFSTGQSVDSSALLGADGTVYFGSGDSYLYAVNSDGTLKWVFATAAPVVSSPASGADGTIYVGSNDFNLYAVNPDGTLKWVFPTAAPVISSPATDADGTIYVGSNDSNLYAVNSDGTLKWVFATAAPVVSSPATDADGTIYVGSHDSNVYAVNPDGTEKWRFTTDSDVSSSPALGVDGTLYVGSDDLNLYAIRPDGTEKWRFTTGGDVNSSPTLGIDDTAYVGSADLNLYAVYPDGTEKWRFTTAGDVISSPALGADGTIYVGSNDFNLYAINAGPTNYTSYFQAESGTIISSFEVAADLRASDGAYVTTAAGAPTLTTGTTEITIPVDLPASGAYYIWARVLGPAPDQDASYVGIDGNFDRVFPSSTGVWQWVAVEVTHGSGDYAHILSVGPHQLVLGHGKAQAQIDVLMITNDASLLPTTDDLVLTLPAFGTWSYMNNTTWHRLDDQEAGLLAVADLDNSGLDDLILTFPGEGTWSYMNNSTWHKLHGLEATLVAVANLDNTGPDDLIVALPGLETWRWMNNSTWHKLHGLEATLVSVANLDNTGPDDLIVALPGLGTWRYLNNTTWFKFDGREVEGVIPAQLDNN